MTRLFGILGFPLRHSLSPEMQNAAFAAARIDAHYVPLSIPPDRIRRALAGLKSSGCSGFNVTVPYKQTVLPFLDRVAPSARAVGAANTIVVHPSTGRWIGHNTDVYGVEMMLRRARISCANKHVLVVGAGGAARAVCAAILGSVRALDILNRTPSRPRALRASLPARARKKIFLWRDCSDADRRHPQVVINATSIGLRRRDRWPLPASLFAEADAAVDLIYNPPMTDFLRRAKKSGCRIVNGVDMLLYQGARAFELWTGRPAPVAAMRRALLRALC